MIKLTFGKNTADGPAAATITIPHGSFGKTLEVESTSEHIWVDGIKARALLYVPGGKFTFTVPEGEFLRAFDKEKFAKDDITISVCEATAEEIEARRDLALNPYDVQLEDEVNPFDSEDFVNPEASVAVTKKEVKCYPHAYANRITRHEGCFFARNAIDGMNISGGHGDYPYQSWGAALYKDPAFTVYFGREVVIDEVCLALRSDYSKMEDGVEHDTCWKSGVLEFSDGTMMNITTKPTSEYQSFKFDKKTVSWVRIKALVRQEPRAFSALNAIRVFGYDDMSI